MASFVNHPSHTMFSASSWLHLRIPFSYFLLPVYLFSLAVSPNFTGHTILWSFIIIHFLLYPASNGYNSYFDKDEGSIGGLKNPPPVKKGLYYLSLLFDLIAIVLGLVLINLTFALMLFVYGVVSKAYSHPSIRIKRYAITGWLITGLFQGFFSIVMCYVGINKFPLDSAIVPEVIWAGILASGMLWANYPITQVYQHAEDSARGDRTFSIMLGIQGTFLFAGAMFALVTAGFMLYFIHFFSPDYAIAFPLFLAPVVLYFLIWAIRVVRDESTADYTHAMWLNFISATCMSAFFVYFFLDHTNVIQVFQ